jgi:hypothetical protein
MKNIIINFIRDLLKYIEILICIRKKFNKTYTFPKNPRCEYYYNKEKFKQPYA